MITKLQFCNYRGVNKVVDTVDNFGNEGGSVEKQNWAPVNTRKPSCLWLLRLIAAVVFNLRREFLNLVVGVTFFRDFFTNLPVRIHHGGVVLATE